MQPNWKRYRKELLCEGEPDRVPLFGVADQEVMSAFMGKPVTTHADQLEFRVASGYDYTSGSVHVDFFAGKEPKEGSRGRDTWKGQTTEWAAAKAGIITSWEDFERHPWPRLEDVDYSPLGKLCKMVPEGMGIMAGVGHIFTDTWRLMGFETFAFALRDDPDLVSAIFHKIGTLVVAVNANILDFEKVTCLKFGDDLAFASGLLIAHKEYRKYLWPWYKQLSKLAREHNKPFALHTDGNLMDVIDDLVECGINGVDPIEQKCNDIRELKRRAAGRICLQGNVGLPYPLAWGTPEEVAIETLELLRDVAPGGCYCLGSSKGAPAYVPVENYRAMVNTLQEYGRYPINIPPEEIESLRRKSQTRARSFATPEPVVATD